MTDRREWPLWEVFVRAKRGLSHTHVGSLHAPDAEMALRNARDLYTRRQEGVSLWVVPAAAITADGPIAQPHRHPVIAYAFDEEPHSTVRSRHFDASTRGRLCGTSS